MEHKRAENNMDDRDKALFESACRIENNLDLLGKKVSLDDYDNPSCAIPYHTKPYHIILCHIIPYHTMSYHTIP